MRKGKRETHAAQTVLPSTSPNLWIAETYLCRSSDVFFFARCFRVIFLARTLLVFGRFALEKHLFSISQSPSPKRWLRVRRFSGHRNRSFARSLVRFVPLGSNFHHYIKRCPTRSSQVRLVSGAYMQSHSGIDGRGPDHNNKTSPTGRERTKRTLSPYSRRAHQPRSIVWLYGCVRSV